METTTEVPKMTPLVRMSEHHLRTLGHISLYRVDGECEPVTAEHVDEITALVSGIVRGELRVIPAGESLPTYDPRTQFVGSREQLAWFAGMTVIPEETTIRPQAMSYVKPTEFALMVQSALRSWLTPESPSPDTTTESR